MATWSDIGTECLSAAHAARDRGHFRTSVSRSYYGVYAIATGAMEERRVSVKNRTMSNPGHEQLAALLGTHGVRPELRLSTLNRQSMLRRCESLFRDLRSRRIDADYRPGRAVDESSARTALRLAFQLRDILKGVRP